MACAPALLRRGSPPPRDVRPVRGLPQGDPASPLFLAYVLAPWTRLVSTVPGIVAHLYADDRSLSQVAEGPGLEEALRLTAWSDDLLILGLTEHRGKRQLWTAAVDRPDSHWVEHLGLHVKPGKACLPETRTGPADVERM